MGTSLFGGGGGAGTGGGGFGQSGMFGASTAAGTAQGTLTASINQPIGANLPIFSMLPPGPRSVSLDQGQPKKKTGFFVDVPTRSPVPRVQLGFTPASSKLRGFGTSVSSSNLGSGMSALSFSSGRPNALSMDASMTSDALTSGRASPALGSGGRQSVKKLILDKKVEPTDLFSRSGSASPGLRGRVTFNPALSVAAREKDAAAPAAIEAPTPVLARNPRTPNRFTAPNTTHTTLDGDIDSGTLKEGDYWSSPDLNTLMNAGHAQLRSCEGLVIGRVGYGEVHFLEPVDLTGLSKLGQLYGEVVRFDDKECSVYPDVDDTEKPAVGTYLNVHARIILLRCWPNDKATREPIKDEKHPAVVRHVKKLKGMRDTDFEGFEMDEGKWTFTVDHF
jgi:nuclear pore complex protein Nup98-Nup96